MSDNQQQPIIATTAEAVVIYFKRERAARVTGTLKCKYKVMYTIIVSNRPQYGAVLVLGGQPGYEKLLSSLEERNMLEE